MSPLRLLFLCVAEKTLRSFSCVWTHWPKGVVLLAIAIYVSVIDAGFFPLPNASGVCIVEVCSADGRIMAMRQVGHLIGVEKDMSEVSKVVNHDVVANVSFSMDELECLLHNVNNQVLVERTRAARQIGSGGSTWESIRHKLIQAAQQLEDAFEQ